jgi:hypothetical protein
MTDNDVVTRGSPLLLFVSANGERHGDLYAALATAGWHVETGVHGAEVLEFAAQRPLALSLIEVSGEPTDVSGCAHGLRLVASASAAAPILALRISTTNSDPFSMHVDAVVEGRSGPESIVRGLDRWRPISLEPTRRIAEMFGSGPIAGMIERLARRLEPALANLGPGAIDRAEAHRLAGLCGTLGFRQAHAAWLDVSLGDEAAIEEVRRTTRLVLAAIARGL